MEIRSVTPVNEHIVVEPIDNESLVSVLACVDKESDDLRIGRVEGTPNGSDYPIGTIVVYKSYSGNTLTVTGKELVVVKEEDIMATVD